jgi:hypothetical protein
LPDRSVSNGNIGINCSSPSSCRGDDSDRSSYGSYGINPAPSSSDGVHFQELPRLLPWEASRRHHTPTAAFPATTPTGIFNRVSRSLSWGWRLTASGSTKGAAAAGRDNLPALLHPQQQPDVKNACWYAANCWPELPADCVPGTFSFAQSGEILPVQAPREGEEWMSLNPCHDKQRWAVLNSQIAVLAGSRNNNDRMMLEQLELLVQPT